MSTHEIVMSFLTGVQAVFTGLLYFVSRTQASIQKKLAANVQASLQLTVEQLGTSAQRITIFNTGSQPAIIKSIFLDKHRFADSSLLVGSRYKIVFVIPAYDSYQFEHTEVYAALHLNFVTGKSAQVDLAHCEKNKLIHVEYV